MALPIHVDTATVETTYVDQYGRPRSGRVSFLYPVDVYERRSRTLITAGTRQINLDENGTLQATLPASSSREVPTPRFIITVTEEFDGISADDEHAEVLPHTQTYHVSIPSGYPETLSLLELPRSNVAPSSTPVQVPLYATRVELEQRLTDERRAREEAGYLTPGSIDDAIYAAVDRQLLTHINNPHPHSAYMPESAVRELAAAGAGREVRTVLLGAGPVAQGDMLPGGFVLTGAYQTYDLHADTAPVGGDLRVMVRRASDGADLALLTLPNGLTDSRSRLRLTQPVGTRVRFVCLDAGATTPASGVAVAFYTDALPPLGQNTPADGSTPYPAQAPTPPPGVTVINVNDSTVGTELNQWTESGAWIDVESEGAWGRNERHTSESGATRTIRFKGRGLRIHASRGPAFGQFSVSIDGGTANVVNLYSTTRTSDELVYWTPLLPDAEHVVKITCIGAKDRASAGTAINVDRAIVFSTATDAPAAPPPPTATGFVRRDGAGLTLNGTPWWFTGYGSLTWSQNAGTAEEVAAMPDTALDAWFDSMRKDGHGLARLFFLNGWSYDKLDRAIAAASRNNVYLMVVLDDAAGAPRTVDWYASEASRDIYRAHMVSVLRRYKNEPRIAFWEYVSKPDEAAAYRSFVDAVGATARMEDPNHLWASGAVAPYWFGDNETSLNNPNYRYVHESPYIDVATLHEWDETEAVSNHLDNCLANSTGKPVLVTQFGVRATETQSASCAYTFTQRASITQRKLAGYLRTPGVVAAVGWAWQPGNGANVCEAENLDADTATQIELRNFVA